MRKPTRATGVRRTRTIRSTAALLGALLVFGSLAPPLALAKHDGDTEGEGTSAPGTLPGLEIGIGHESGDEETTLSEESVGPEESEIEEEVPAPESEEAEPEDLEATPVPAPEEPLPPDPEVVVPIEEAPTGVSEPVPTPAEAPNYGVPPAPPTYQPSPSAPPPAGEAVVQNETISGPTPRSSTPAKKSSRPTRSVPSELVPEPEPAPEVPVAPEPAPSPPAVIPAAAPDRAGSLTGRKTHLVAAGECLWTIAAAYLPDGASNSEIAAVVHRLWRLNAERIGTGDPDSLPVGVKLKLG